MFDPYDFEKVVLDSGTEMFFKKLDYASKLCLGILVGVGGRDGERGLSHFLEHCLFLRPGKFSDILEVEKLIDDMGGSAELGSTSRTATCFKGFIPAKNAEVLFDVFNQILVYPRFPNEKVEKEKQVVINEIATAANSAEIAEKQMNIICSAYEEEREDVIRRLFGRLGRLGTPNIVKEFTPIKLWDHFRRYYKAPNTKVVIVGNFEKKMIMNLVDKYPFSFNADADFVRSSISNGLQTPIKPLRKETETTISEFTGMHPGSINFSVINLDMALPPHHEEELSIFKDILRDEIFRLVRYGRGETYSPSFSTSYCDDITHLNIVIKTTGGIRYLLNDFQAASNVAISSKALFENCRKHFMLSSEVFNESSESILKSAIEDLMIYREIRTIEKEVEAFKRLGFSQYRKYCEDVLGAMHTLIIHP